MRLFKAGGWVLAAAVFALAMPSVVSAQIPCQLQGCPGACADPGGPCIASLSITHLGNICSPGGGSFNLIGTQYENTCNGNLGGTCPMVGVVPPLRMWGTGNGFGYQKANSGCANLVTTDWMHNAKPDLGVPVPNGHWFMLGGDWSHSKVAGCGLGAALTVGEISDVNTTTEGSANHGSWYLIAGAPNTGSGFDFDSVTGATGCSTGDVVQAPVAGLSLPGRTGAACQTNVTPIVIATENANNSFFDVAVTMDDPTPDWFSDAGLSKAPALIRGYQVMYAKGPTAPTTSSATGSVWLAARDATDPTKGAAAVPVATTGATISLPKADCGNPNICWLATRLVYEDPINVAGAFDVASNTPGQNMFLTSDISQHCGPVTFDTVVGYVRFTSLTAERTAAGISVRWETADQEDTLRFRVMRSTVNERHPESDFDAGGVDAMAGSDGAYHVVDSSVAGDASTTYYYYVVEYTNDNQPGVSSLPIKVEGVASGSSRRGTSAGGRTRNRR